MAILDIKKFPDPILKKIAEPVQDIDSGIQNLIDDMIETLYDAPGLGLAAPQVGFSKRIFVFDLGAHDERFPLATMINPEIQEVKGKLEDTEGCLSVPGHQFKLVRPKWIRIQGLDRNGKNIQFEGEGLTARLFQHEMDHLNGMVLIDRLSSLKKNIFLKKLKKKAKMENL